MIQFNLVPKNLRGRSRTAVNWLRVGAIVAVAVTVLVVAGSAFNHMSLTLFNQELEELRAGVLQAEARERELRELRQENQGLQRELEKLDGLGDDGGVRDVLDFLSALSGAATDGVLLEFVEYSRGGVTLVAGLGVDPDEVSRFFERVKRIPGVEQAALSQLRRAGDGDGALRWFELRLQWEAGA